MNKILNTFYGLVNPNISLLYSPSAKIFDAIIYSIEDLDYYIYNDIVQNYYYDIFFSNNFLSHTNETKRLCNSSHIKDLIGFHSYPPNNFKKEDIVLVNNNLNNIHKIIFDEDMIDYWKFEPSNYLSVIEYGIPRSENPSNSTNNNILIFNLEQNPQIDIIYNNIKSFIPNIDIIRSINMNLGSIDSLLNNYGILVDFGNKINVLYCLSRGLKCITPLDTNLDGVFKINDYRNIVNVIKDVLKITLDAQTKTKIAENIFTNYDYETFKKQIINKLKNIKNEIFKL